MGERTESSDESFAQNGAPKSKPPKKKLKLSVTKDKENRWQFVDKATEAAFSKQFVPKNTATSTPIPHFKLLCLVQTSVASYSV